MHEATCPTCGTKAPEGALRCPRDGTLLAAAPPVTLSIEEAQARAQLAAETPAAPEVDPLVGQRIGEYEIQQPLGAGGMGVVYRALQPVIGKAVAVKVLRWEIARDPGQMQRLVSEARTVNAIRHRGIIDIFNMGQLPDGRQYLVMELLDGVPLDRVMSGPLPFAEALAFLDELADALAAAHSVGVIHRDLKPSNVFVVTPTRGARYLKLLDFGLAKQASAPGGTTPQTRASLLVGTPHYMAPEQARGEEIGPHTDLYALGVMAFEMLTGRLPFEAPTPFEIIYKHLNERAPRASSLRPDVPPVLDELVARMLEKDRALRPPGADELRAALEPLRDQFPLPRNSSPSLQPVAAALPAPLPLKLDPTFVSGRVEQPAPVESGGAAKVSEAAVAPPPVSAPLVPTAPVKKSSRATAVAIAGGALAVVLGGVALVGRAPAKPPPQAVAIASVEPANPPAPAIAPKPVAPAPAVAAAEVKPSGPAKVSLTSNQPCEAFEGERALGKVPLSELELSPGAHTLRCRNAFGGEASLDLQLEPASARSESFNFRGGQLQVWVLPYADVSVDGKNVGETPIPALDLAEGQHRVVFAMEAKRVTKTVKIAAGETVKLKVNMDAP